MKIQESFYPTVPVTLPITTQAPISNETVRKIKTLAKEAFLQVSLAFAINVAVITFIATPLSVVVMSGAIIGAISSFVIQIAVDYYYQHKDAEALKDNLESIKHTSQTSIVNVVGLAGPNIAIHEAGHAATAWAFFKKSNPEITIFPFFGGMTSFTYSHGLTKLGSFIGQHPAFMVITAAGILSSTFFAMFEFGLSEAIQDSYPTLSRLMTVHGILQITQEVLYGLTAFISSKTDLAHDFVNLWITGGIHPLIPIAMMIALPMAEMWLIKHLSNREKSQKISEIALPIYPQVAFSV